jgi:putative CocE/NonD family hydrolase
MNLPILTITGHYDDDQLGNMSHYRNFMANASPDAKAKVFLVIGPYDHAGTRTPQPEVGGVKFGPASMLDMNRLHKEWYDFTLKGGSKPDFLKKPVAYYVMGAEQWKYADNLESIASARNHYYLTSTGSANDVFHSGTLTTTVPDNRLPDQIVYNPLDTRTGLDARSQENDPATLKRQFDVMNHGLEGVVYHSSPFADTTEVSGFIKLMLYVSADVPDIDLSATLYEITPSGESIYLTSDVMRLRYRESLEYEKLMKPGEVYACTFSNFNFFSKQIPRRSRLRIVVAAINSIAWEKNYCSGGVVAQETAKDARTATVKIYHEKKYPSHVEVPIAK